MLIPFDHLFTKYNIKSLGALHVGANIGQEAEAYHIHGVEKVVWIEANPILIPRLRKHVSNYPGDIVLEACVGDEDGKTVKFHVASNNGQSSSVLEFGTHRKEHPDVRFTHDIEMTMLRLETLLSSHNVVVGPGWFLNMDLQGAELMALKGMGDLLHQFDHAYIEVNVRELYKGCPFVSEIDDYLANYGFTPMDSMMTGSGWGDRYYKRK